ncbi:MAG: metallophosphoesterase [Burkholderiaceae bacterium]|nr:metallophosphoesterase [Burkholderiaceae bacterium]
MNRSFLFALALLLHALVGWRLVPDLPGPAGLALAGLLAVSAVLMPLALVMRRQAGDGATARALSWAGMLCMGLFSSLFVLTVVRDVGLLALLGFGRLWPLAADMAHVHSATASAVVAIAGLVTLLGLWNARRTAAVVTVDVPVTDLPASLEGFTIAQLSDVHVGPTIGRRYLEAIVARVNAMDADAVAITGDLVDGSVPQLAAHVAPLAALRSRHGTFFVTGNHEYYSGAHAWIAELRRLGLTVLLNQHVVLDDGAGARPLVLAGVTDVTAHVFDPAHRSDPARALAGSPPDAVRVLLAHQPRSATAAERAGFDVQLSGHTHGGQFWPWNLFVPLQQPFVAGLARLGRLRIYTSRGTGYWGPPKRLGAPSEITRVRLVRAA